MVCLGFKGILLFNYMCVCCVCGGVVVVVVVIFTGVCMFHENQKKKISDSPGLELELEKLVTSHVGDETQTWVLGATVGACN